MAQIIALWTDIIEGKIHKEDCTLELGDNSRAMGWLRRSNFRQKDEFNISWDIKQQPGRHRTIQTLNTSITIYKKWMKGTKN